MPKPKRVASVRRNTGTRGPAGPRGRTGARGPSGGLSRSHIDRIAELREQLQAAIREAEPVKTLQDQVQGALQHVDEIAQVRQQLQNVQKEQQIQLVRIAQMQAQLDKLMGILMKT